MLCQRRYRHWLILIIGLVLLVGCTLNQPAGSTTEAPIIIDVRARYCELSSDGTYMAVGEENVGGFTLYRLDTATAVAFPPRRGMSGVWIDDTTWFEYASDKLVGTSYQPTDGWIVDLRLNTVTDILTLDPGQRQQTLDTVNALLGDPTRSEVAQISPNGLYEAQSSNIYAHTGPTNGQVKKQFHTSRSTSGCKFGWKADSSGFYFIEHGAALRGNPPGPIRFLPVNP